ncbi:MAG: alanine racemase, partial [Clostridiales bacterium]|nr:alanine racemase [Clostridiales bacterium]
GPNRINLIPVMNWLAKVIHVKEVDEGTSVSYGRHFIAKRKTKVLTVSVGYADGLSRRFSNGFELLVNGERLPIIGNVCMDMCMLDATDMKQEVKKGDTVVIFGKERLADELADYLGTINYEITCDVGKRVQRIFVD